MCINHRFVKVIINLLKTGPQYEWVNVIFPDTCMPYPALISTFQMILSYILKPYRDSINLRSLQYRASYRYLITAS